jgi:hypothetical protein
MTRRAPRDDAPRRARLRHCEPKAKQSTPLRLLDRFVAALLAMTRLASPRPRHCEPKAKQSTPLQPLDRFVATLLAMTRFAAPRHCEPKAKQSTTLRLLDRFDAALLAMTRRAAPRHCEPKAKQSTPLRLLDRFVAALLAMTPPAPLRLVQSGAALAKELRALGGELEERSGMLARRLDIAFGDQPLQIEPPRVRQLQRIAFLDVAEQRNLVVGQLVSHGLAPAAVLSSARALDGVVALGSIDQD